MKYEKGRLTASFFYGSNLLICSGQQALQQGLGFFMQGMQMLFSKEAFRIDLADSLRPGRPDGEPAVPAADLDPANGSSVPRGCRQDLSDRGSRYCPHLDILCLQ